jgi:hypothetical protein
MADAKAQPVVVSSVKEAVETGLSPTVSASTAEAQTKQLLECFDDESKAPSQCFADAGYTDTALVGVPAEVATCTPDEVVYVGLTFTVTVPAGCAITVGVWGGGGSGGGAVDGLPGGDTRFFGLVAGGGGGGKACAAGGAGGVGGRSSSARSSIEVVDGNAGGNAADVAAGVGGAGANGATPPGDGGMIGNGIIVVGKGGEPGKDGTPLGGGGGGATGTTNCGGGGGGGAYIGARFTMKDLIAAGAVPTASGSVELQGETGVGGGIPLVNGSAGAGAGANGGVLVKWVPEASEGGL